MQCIGRTHNRYLLFYIEGCFFRTTLKFWVSDLDSWERRVLILIKTFILFTMLWDYNLNCKHCCQQAKMTNKLPVTHSGTFEPFDNNTIPISPLLFPLIWNSVGKFQILFTFHNTEDFLGTLSSPYNFYLDFHGLRISKMVFKFSKSWDRWIPAIFWITFTTKVHFWEINKGIQTLWSLKLGLPMPVSPSCVFWISAWHFRNCRSFWAGHL